MITKKEEKSLIDITLLDNEFFVEMLNRIIAHKKSEVQHLIFNISFGIYATAVILPIQSIFFTIFNTF